MFVFRTLVVSIVLALAASAVADAQGPVYTATPPTKGALYRDGQTDRYLLGGIWLYRADLTDVGLAQNWQNGGATDGWSTVTVPNAYNAGQFTPQSMAGYVSWYRRDFIVPTDAFPKYVPKTARHWIVNFQSVNYGATVWLNGHKLGTHTGAYLPFEFDLTGVRTGVNRLVVRVDNRRSASDFPPGPGGQWWNYGGLLEEVYLRAVARADISQVQVRPVLPCPSCAATIEEQALIRNVTGAPQAVHLSGYYGHARLNFGSSTIGPHATWTATAATTIAHPSLWAIGHPTLYRATLNLTDAKGKSLGGYVDYSGIRSITVTQSGRLELNGRLLHLRGFNLHEQTLSTGAALSVEQMRRLIDYARSLGADALRAHYPLTPALQEMADEDGILVWSEIPVYQVKTPAMTQPGWQARALALLKANILANQNHPSVMVWSIGNELPTPVTNSEASYISAAAALARQLDPTRPVALAASNWPGVACQPAYAPLDVIGFNDYFGWFDAGDGATADRSGLSPFLDSFQACYPNKALIVTEFGFDGNRVGPLEEYGTYAFQSDAIAYHLGVFATKPWLSGAMYFALQNYAAYPGYNGGDPLSDPPFNEKGVIDFQGNPKPSASVIGSIYRSTVQIAARR
ncbi:MAG TPA: glycoside hydrolase family 2 TIM barrel-domain containing protein [Solirubrobacteraceae bacterium]|nr:glycoside hydrolase family 2 TIM barrel-domain containing protein [Solirubrobacteraceae bacterium]